MTQRMTHHKPALDALTDQALAHLATERHNPDEVTQVQVTVARDMAAMFLAQFGDQPELAGRVIVMAAQAITQILREMRGQIPDYQLPGVMANVLAFAGEMVTHHDAGGSRE